jgi:hypothetical protein
MVTSVKAPLVAAGVSATEVAAVAGAASVVAAAATVVSAAAVVAAAEGVAVWQAVMNKDIAISRDTRTRIDFFISFSYKDILIGNKKTYINEDALAILDLFSFLPGDNPIFGHLGDEK